MDEDKAIGGEAGARGRASLSGADAAEPVRPNYPQLRPSLSLLRQRVRAANVSVSYAATTHPRLPIHKASQYIRLASRDRSSTNYPPFPTRGSSCLAFDGLSDGGPTGVRRDATGSVPATGDCRGGSRLRRQQDTVGYSGMPSAPPAGYCWLLW